MKRCMLTKQRFTIQSVEPTDIEVVWHDCVCNKGGITEVKKQDIEKYVIVFCF